MINLDRINNEKKSAADHLFQRKEATIFEMIARVVHVLLRIWFVRLYGKICE